ncbi:MAG: caspase family protein, partial [Waterburya sp.]
MAKEFDRSFAVVIGINNYQNGIDTLQTAVPDAVAIAKILKLNYKYNLVSPYYELGIILDRDATKENIEYLLNDYLPNKIKPTKSDRLLVYFAGHGIARNSDEGLEGYLVPQDADMKDRDSLLKMRDVHDWLAQLECRHLLVILDCCFAGTFRWASYRKLIPISQDITEAHYDRFIRFPASQVLTSASHNQEALDFLNNRDVEANRRHSPFAEGLIEALQQEKGDLNNDGVIIATELYLYLRDYVELNSQEKQTPGFFPLKKHDRGEYIFKLPNTPLKLKDTPKLNKENNPYRGLDPFEEKHAALFFGREEVIKELFTKVSQPHHQLTVVSGISGSGKSSLVQAGLIPCLRKNQAHQWLIFDPIRPGTNPYTSLARALSQLDSNLAEQSSNTPISGKQAQEKSSQLIQPIKTWSQQNLNSRLLLVIDQLEELITMAVKAEPSSKKQQQSWLAKIRVKLGLSKREPKQDTSEEESEEWKEFIELLANILHQCPQLSLVVTLRSDFEPRFQNSAFNSDWANARFIVRPMHSDELREAVEKPAAEKALYFEPPELVDRLVDEVSQMPGALPLLSFTLSEMYIKLYEAWRDEGKEDRALTVAKDFELKGGVAGALTRRANEEYKNLPDDAYRVTIRHLMMRMVSETTGSLARRQVPASELIYSNEKKNEQVKELISRFVEKRLLVTGTNIKGEVYYEPTHDILVNSWIKELLESSKRTNLYKLNVFEELSLQFSLRNDVEQYTKNAKKIDFLWDRNPRLEQINQILKSDDNWLNNIETEFVRYSIKKREYFAIESLKARSKEELQKQNQLEALAIAIEVGEKLQYFLSIPEIKIEIDDEKIEQIKQELQQIIYDVQERHRLQGHKHWLWGINFNSDGKKIVSACRDGTVKVWSCNGQELQHIEAHSPKEVTYACFSPDGKTIATASADKTVKIWVFNEPQQQWCYCQTLQGHNNTVWSISFKDDETMVTGSRDKTAKLWCFNGYKWYLKKTIEGNDAHNAEVHCVTFSSDGKTLATASFDGTIKLWDLHGNWQKTLQTEGNENGFNNVSFSPDGKLIIAACDDRTIKRWTINGEELKPLEGHKDWVKCAVFSPNNQLIASSSADNTIKLWSVEGEELKTLKGHQNEIWSICFSPDSQTIASASWDRTVRIWSSKVDQHKVIKGHETAITSIAFHPNDDIFATGSWDNKVKFWNFSGEELLCIDCKDPVRSIAFSPNGQLIATGCENGAVIIWNLQGKLLKRWREHERLKEIQSVSVTGISFSPDGKILASTSEDRTVKLWDVSDLNRNRSVKTINKHTEHLTSVCFSPNAEETTLASACWGGIVYFSSIGDVETSQKPIKHDEAVMSICFSTDSKTIATASRDRTAKLWSLDSEKPKELATFKGHTG